MNYFTPPTPLVLYTDLRPDECERRMREAIDEVVPAIFSFSGYCGNKPFMGAVNGRKVVVIQRTFGRGSLPTAFSGELQSHKDGTRVKGSFDLEIASKILLCLVVVAGLLFIILIVSSSYKDHPVLSIAFACGYCGLLLFTPRSLRGSGIKQEKAIANFLRELLVADDDLSNSGMDAGL